MDALEAAGEVERLAGLAGDLVADADLIFHVWFRAGEPVVPVFWGFGFVIIHDQEAVVFLGASSD